MADDRMEFLEGTEEPQTRPSLRPWRLLIADDEEEVHRVTKMVLQDFSFEGRGLEILSAYSGEEARRVIAETEDIAVILLDVVMESDHSGLDLVGYIRHNLQNRFVRIILRTGQPGSAPERDVIQLYDINDYKEKTELTSQKLFTVVTASIRNYRDIRVIERNRRGLERIVFSSAHLFEIHSLKDFAVGVLTQLTGFLHFEEDSLYLRASGLAVSEYEGEYLVLAGTGQFEGATGKHLDHAVDERIKGLVGRAIETSSSFFSGSEYLGFFRSPNGSENVLYMRGKAEITPDDQELINLFAKNIAVAFDNIFLNKELRDNHLEAVQTLGEIIESREAIVERHVRAVGAIAEKMGGLLGMSEGEQEVLRLAAPLHDVGKVAVRESLLNTPGELSDDQFDEVKGHTTKGHEILAGRQGEVMRVASVIALEHHERWDGTGYPFEKKGKEISIHARITAVADVFDSLLSPRVYRDAMNGEIVREVMRREQGRAFDPDLVELLLEHYEEFLALRNSIA